MDLNVAHEPILAMQKLLTMGNTLLFYVRGNLQ